MEILEVLQLKCIQLFGNFMFKGLFILFRGHSLMSTFFIFFRKNATNFYLNGNI
jgi:hypothetical protein